MKVKLFNTNLNVLRIFSLYKLIKRLVKLIHLDSNNFKKERLSIVTD